LENSIEFAEVFIFAEIGALKLFWSHLGKFNRVRGGFHCEVILEVGALELFWRHFGVILESFLSVLGHFDLISLYILNNSICKVDTSLYSLAFPSR
jgi:hypothetical protein